MDLTGQIIEHIRAQLATPILVIGSSVISIWTIIYLVALTTLLWYAARAFRSWLLRHLMRRYKVRARLAAQISWLARYALFVIGILEIIDFSELDLTAVQIVQALDMILSRPLVTLGRTQLNLWSFIYLIVFALVLLFASGQFERWLLHHVLRRSRTEFGVKQATAAIVRYVIVGLGFIIMLQTAGIDLSTLTVAAGALGLGIGFGLQSIAANIVAGFFVLFERPVRIGDRIQVGDVYGDIVKISLRASTVKTNDNIEIVVPNSEFIDQKVTNWTLSSKEVRISVPLGVSYSSDPEVVREILLAVASLDSGVLKAPAPDVIFTGFGESSLDFELRVWTTSYATIPRILRSQLYFAIFKAFKERGIQIPFPQRDIHIKSGGAGLPSS